MRYSQTAYTSRRPCTARRNVAAAPAAARSLQPLLWSFAGHAQPQDEREAKRLRRKQSNRESARRSRMKKQAECEGLAETVQRLSVRIPRLLRFLQQKLPGLQFCVPGMDSKGTCLARSTAQAGFETTMSLDFVSLDFNHNVL